MSTSPTDTLGDRIEFGANIAKFATTTPPDDNPSSKTTSNVPENRTVLTQFSPIETDVQTAEDGNSLVGRPQSRFATRSRSAKSRVLAGLRLALAMRSGKQPRRARTTKSATSRALKATRKSIPSAKSRFLAALRLGKPRRLLLLLRSVTKDPGFIAALPDTTILRILRLLDPNSFLEPYRLLYRYVAPNMIKRLNYAARIMKLLIKFKSAYLSIVQSLATHHKHLDFQKYEAFLKLAQATGDVPLGTKTWKHMLKNKVKPDVVFYNSYFEALCWPNVFSPRCPEEAPWDTPELVAVQRIVSNMFTQMIAEGVMADTKTFALLMTAYSRAGDLKGVKTILKNVWHIDVDAIINADSTSGGLGDHPAAALHPTPYLLFTIAHVFGSNNNIAVGMRVVDHVSQSFGVPLDDRTWQELTVWTYTNSRRSTRGIPWFDSDPELIPHGTLEDVWELEPFGNFEALEKNSPPKVSLQHRIIRMYYYRHKHGHNPMLKAMLMFLLQHKRSSSAFIRGLKFDKARWFILAPETLDAFLSKTLPSYLEMIRNLYMISLWVGLLLNEKNHDLEWEREKIPDIVNLFWPYRDKFWGLDYGSKTGTVKLRRTNPSLVECQDFDLNRYLDEENSSPLEYR